MNRRDLYLVCATVFPFMVCTGMVYSVISLYMAELGLTKSQIGALYTAGAVAGAVSSPFVGALADRLGRKRVLLASMTLFALVFLGYALSRTRLSLLAVQVCEGLAWASMGTSATALIADLVTVEERGKAMGIYNTTWNLGWIAGPTLGGTLSDAFGFTATFLLCTALTILGIALAVPLIPSRPKGPGQ
ncbi:MAG TPA: MFS transporter [Syntrophales bacterium]|nr:MFS transporter [Syntrophales bacterium]HOM06326.1 MFS transporter [Syntrophales bacterium]HON99235.1 MFS transporter [Syntrophales bacterium]HPC00060.1 MFS transporter [Syntrophales bacterium]HPQ05693.1 MFS transporter [Syntrophales bacterium]